MYISLSLLLAAISITTPPPPPPSLSLSAAAFSTLHHHNFTITATLLHLSPSLSTPSTIFAIHDSAFSALITTAAPSSLKLLLLYHSLPYKLSLKQLLLIPQNSCISSNLPSKNLSLTKTDQNTIVINNVPVSHPDLFQDQSISIHGVLASFSPPDFIVSPHCEYSSNRTSEYPHNWIQIIRGLSSNGFISFAIGLNSVLNGIITEYPNLGPITIFAPPEFNFVSSSGPYLDQIVRYHVVRERYSYQEIASMPEKAQMTTLLRGEALEITRSRVNGSRLVGINGVYVVSPDIFSADWVVVHGISSAFEFINHANT